MRGRTFNIPTKVDPRDLQYVFVFNTKDPRWNRAKIRQFYRYLKSNSITKPFVSHVNKNEIMLKFSTVKQKEDIIFTLKQMMKLKGIHYE